MKLIKLPNGNWVNPDHVSSIEITLFDDRPKTKVVMDGAASAYSTKGDQRDELAALLNASQPGGSR